MYQLIQPAQRTYAHSRVGFEKHYTHIIGLANSILKGGMEFNCYEVACLSMQYQERTAGFCTFFMRQMTRLTFERYRYERFYTVSI